LRERLRLLLRECRRCWRDAARRECDRRLRREPERWNCPPNAPRERERWRRLGLLRERLRDLREPERDFGRDFGRDFERDFERRRFRPAPKLIPGSYSSGSCGCW
jgi:hypothetical protein